MVAKLFSEVGGPEKGRCGSGGRVSGCSRASSIPGFGCFSCRRRSTSSGEGPPGCWEGHRPGRSSHRSGVCSAPRRYGWRAGDDVG